MMHVAGDLGDFVMHRKTRLPGDGQPLPSGLRWALEKLSGYDLSEVRVYYASNVPARLGARALARGTEIHLQTGAEDVLPHEAWHVVQQMQGRVEPTDTVNGLSLNDNVELEKEADEMGAMAAALSWAGMWQRAKGVLQKVRIKKPVVQRNVKVANDVYADAQAIRDKLSQSCAITTDNTVHLTTIVNDLVANNRVFANLTEIKSEVKRRNFGMRHVDAIEALLTRDDYARARYLAANYSQLTTEQATEAIGKIITAMIKASGNPKSVKNAAAKLRNDLTFIRWSSASTFLKLAATKAARDADYYKWLRDNSNPLAMNCWENTLFSGAWTNNGARAALYSKGYAIWALQDRDTKKLSYAKDDNAEIIQVPHYVKHVVDNPTAHETDRDANGRARKLPAPTSVQAGNIVVLNSGAHVALATGRRCQVFSADARKAYGNEGYEIIELDGWTRWMQRSTIEDCIAFGGYNAEWHLGWMPEVEKRETVFLADSATGEFLLEAELTPTQFYT